MQVCRQYNIERWPFRKRSSLDRLIVKTRQYFSEDKQHAGGETLARLEAEKEAMKVGGPSQAVVDSSPAVLDSSPTGNGHDRC